MSELHPKYPWNHILCDSCYQTLEPNREPVRFKEEFRTEEKCCRCGCKTFSGIFYRASPTTFEHCASTVTDTKDRL